MKMRVIAVGTDIRTSIIHPVQIPTIYVPVGAKKRKYIVKMTEITAARASQWICQRILENY